MTIAPSTPRSNPWLVLAILSLGLIDYEPMPLCEMIGFAELAVSGHVAALGEETIHFAVTEVLLGEVAERELEVRQATPWPPGSPRPAPYAVGQSFVLFLVRDPETGSDAPWRILGLEGGGELPIVGDEVFLRGRRVEYREAESHRVHGVDLVSQRFPRLPFLDAVEGYARCFVWRREGNRRWPRQTCDGAALEAYRSRSPLHAYLVSTSLESSRDP